MSTRKEIFANGEFYHIYNRSIAGIPIFEKEKAANLFISSAEYYLYKNPPTKFSIYRLNKERFLINQDEAIVSALAFSIMPNHFHFILRQNEENGIQNFIRRVSNSFAHYYSVRNGQNGHVFQGSFKAKHIENENQLLHISRYIHLNPVTSYLTENAESYPYSSYPCYLGNNIYKFVDTSVILDIAGGSNLYKKFVEDQKDYQRKLRQIKNLLIEEK